MKPTPWIAVALLASRAAAADTGMSDVLDEMLRVKLAYAEVVAACAPTEKRVQLRPSFGDTAPRQLTISRSAWSGGCAGKFTDGEGVMSIDAKTSDGKPVYFVPQHWQGSGLMVKGKQAGPWLVQAFDSGATIAGRPAEPSWNLGLYVWEDTVYPGVYRREPNGDFTAMTYGYPPGEKLGATSKLVALPLPSVPGISAAAAGRHKQSRQGQGGVQPPQFALPLLTGLLPEATVAYAPEGPLRDIRGKSAVLVLSQGTAAAMQNMDKLRAQLQAFADRETDPALRKALTDLSTAPDSSVLARDLAVSLRRHFKSVTLVTDLRGFLASQADYAVVVDLSFDYDFKQFTSAYEAASKDQPALDGNNKPLRGGVGAVVLNRQLQAQASWPAMASLMPALGSLGSSRSGLKSMLEVQLKMMRNTFGEPATPGKSQLVTNLAWGLAYSE